MPEFRKGSAKHMQVTRSRSHNFPNNDAETIPTLYIIRKSKISPITRTDDSARVARQVRSTSMPNFNDCKNRRFQCAETVLGGIIRFPTVRTTFTRIRTISTRSTFTCVVVVASCAFVYKRWRVNLPHTTLNQHYPKLCKWTQLFDKKLTVFLHYKILF